MLLRRTARPARSAHRGGAGWARAKRSSKSSDASLTLLELTQAQAWLGVPERSEELNALKQAMRTPDASGTSLAGRSEDIRIALRLLESR